MASKGYQGVITGAGNFNITRIYLNDESPFPSKALMVLDMSELEINMNGAKIRPWREEGFIFNYILSDVSQKRH